MPPVPSEQHALVAQARERRAHPQRVLGMAAERLRDLDDRDVRRRIEESQRDPCPVVEAAVGVGLGLEARFIEQPRRQRRQARVAPGRISDRVELRGKPAEIVDRLELRRSRHADRARRFPVPGDDDDGARLRKRRREGAERSSPRVVLERGHRRAVRDEEGREA